MRFVRVLLHSTTCATLLFAPCGSARAQVAAPFPSTSPPPATPPPDVTVAVPPPVDEGVTGIPALADALRSQQMTPAQAWDKGLLDAASALALLRQGTFGGERDEDQERRVALASVLMNYAPDALLQVAATDPNTKRTLADYYASRGDKRAASLYEEVLRDTPELYKRGLLFKALGDFWVQQHQPEQAEAAYLRGRDALTGTHRHFAGEMLVMAGRAWLADGRWERARPLYARVAAEGDGWMTGLALFDQADAFITQGRHDEARRLLNTPVKGPGAEAIQVALLSLLGYSYYRSAEWEAARRYSEEAVTRARTAEKLLPPGGGLEGYIAGAQERLRLMARWPKEPLICTASELRIVVDAGAKRKEPIRGWLGIHSFREVAVTAISSHPQVSTRLQEKAEDRGHFFERQLVVEVAPELISQGKSLDVMLTVSSPQFPRFEARVPLHLEIVNGSPKTQTAATQTAATQTALRP